MSVPVVALVDVGRRFEVGGAVVNALAGVDLVISPGEMVAILGTSGSGKSTLLNVLGCLDRPSSGEYRLDGEDVATLDDDALAGLRNARLGFVFQSFNLLPRTSALDNVALPLFYGRHRPGSDPLVQARIALERVGLGDRLHHHPNQLSGGQQQRVAIARALVTEPSLLLADEPTGNLDSHTTVEVMVLLQSLHAEGKTIILVTHERDVAMYCQRAITLADGRIVRDDSVSQRSAEVDLVRLDAERLA